MKNRTVYLETSFISYLTAETSRDIVTAGHQVRTHEWWKKGKEYFDIYVNLMLSFLSSRLPGQAGQ